MIPLLLTRNDGKMCVCDAEKIIMIVQETNLTKRTVIYLDGLDGPFTLTVNEHPAEIKQKIIEVTR